MSGATTYPISPGSDTDNTVLRGILYALYNSGAKGLAPQQPSNTLLRQILFAIQKGAVGYAPGQSSSTLWQQIEAALQNP